jgi:hypothetical protein
VRTGWIAVLVFAGAACAGCSSGSPSGSSASNAASELAISTNVVAVSSTNQLGEMVKWDATNKTRAPQLATCEVLVLNGSTQLGELGPLQLTVAAGATAEQYSEVTTLAGNGVGDTAQIVCQKG